MSLGDFLGLLRRRWAWVAGVALLAVSVAGIGSAAADRSYTATSGVFFSLEFGDSASDLAQGSTYTQNQVASYALLARTPTVLGPVIEREGLETDVAALAGQLSTSVVTDTVVVEIAATDRSPARAATIANAVAEQLGRVVEELAPVSDSGDPTVRATTVTVAEPPGAPTAPRTRLNLAVGLLAGLLLGVLAALARDVTDTRVRTQEDVQAISSLPLLAALDTGARPDGRRDLVVTAAPRSPQAEAFRGLRTAVQFVGIPGRALSLLVTSARPAEGKSTVAANLAIAIAEAGLRVLLVDADLRRPSVAETFGLEGEAGLTSVLIGQAEVADVVQGWGAFGLHVLAAGPVPPNPSELLASPAMAALMARLEADYDAVIVDTSPMLAVTDPVVLSRVVSGTLLVGDVSALRRTDVRDSVTLLERAHARVVGMVLTHVRRRAEGVYAYGPLTEPETDDRPAEPADLVPGGSPGAAAR